MSSATSLDAIERRISQFGLMPIVEFIVIEDIGEKGFEFFSNQNAKRAQRVIYQWLTFHPHLKETTTLSITPGAGTTLVVRRGHFEKRGRRGGS